MTTPTTLPTVAGALCERQSVVAERPLQTVGQFRAAWKDLPDDAAVEIVFTTEARGRVDLVSTVGSQGYGILIVDWVPASARSNGVGDILRES